MESKIRKQCRHAMVYRLALCLTAGLPLIAINLTRLGMARTCPLLGGGKVVGLMHASSFKRSMGKCVDVFA